MAKHYEEFKMLIVASAILGYYMSSIEKIYGEKWYLKCLKCMFYFSAIVNPSLFFVLIKYVFYDEGEIGPKSFGVGVTFYYFLTTFFVYSFYFNKEKFVKLFEQWDLIFEDDLFPEDRQLLISKSVQMVNKWLVIFGGANIIAPALYSGMNYFNKDKDLGHPSGIPYKHEFPDFELLNTLDLVSTCTGFATLITYDLITMAFFCLEEAQFRHLKNSLVKIMDIISVTEKGEILINNKENVFDNVGDENANEQRMRKCFAEVEEKLKIWVSHHQKLLRFHDELQKLYHGPFSLKFLVFVVICCVTGFLLATMILQWKMSTRSTLLAAVFCVNNYAIFYVNITFADSIRTTAATIFGEVFDRAWYLYPKKIKTALKIIVMRSHRPVQYRAIWMYRLNSETFLKILSLVYSFSTFLLQVDQKKF